MMKRGDLLSLDAQREALARFVHRYTGDHQPAWVSGMTCLQSASDAEWLAHTYFEVTKAGKLHRGNAGRYCYSYPTWPQSPHLQGTPGSAQSLMRRNGGVMPETI